MRQLFAWLLWWLPGGKVGNMVGGFTQEEYDNCVEYTLNKYKEKDNEEI